MLTMAYQQLSLAPHHLPLTILSIFLALVPICYPLLLLTFDPTSAQATPIVPSSSWTHSLAAFKSLERSEACNDRNFIVKCASGALKNGSDQRRQIKQFVLLGFGIQIRNGPRISLLCNHTSHLKDMDLFSNRTLGGDAHIIEHLNY